MEGREEDKPEGAAVGAAGAALGAEGAATFGAGPRCFAPGTGRWVEGNDEAAAAATEEDTAMGDTRAAAAAAAALAWCADGAVGAGAGAGDPECDEAGAGGMEGTFLVGGGALGAALPGAPGPLSSTTLVATLATLVATLPRCRLLSRRLRALRLALAVAAMPSPPSSVAPTPPSSSLT